MGGWDKFRYRMLRGFARGMGSLPAGVLYGFVLNMLYGILYRVVGYRKKVVRTNLENSFPEKSADELHKIEKDFYHHLAEVFVDAIYMSAVSNEDILKRITMIGLEQHEEQTRGQDWIAALAHYGSWEYFSAYQLLTSTQVAGVYRPLKDPAADTFFKEVRSRFGMETVAKATLLRYIVRHKNEGEGRRNIAIGLIADQTPPWKDINCWFEFLNQPTPFYEGVERLALKFNMPVYFLHLRKRSVGHYDGWFEQIYDGKSAVEPYEIICRYAALLEADIREQPACWMWSHRRWKRKPEARPEIPYIKK